jgi:hypothetical protein
MLNSLLLDFMVQKWLTLKTFNIENINKKPILVKTLLIPIKLSKIKQDNK